MKKRTAVIALTLFVLAGCTAQTTGTAVEEASPARREDWSTA